MDTSKRSDKAPMTCNVVSWKGVLMYKRQLGYCAEVVIKFPNELRDISFYLGITFAKCDRWLTRFAKSQV